MKSNKKDIKFPLFKCDICGKEKSTLKIPFYDENYNLVKGLIQCEDCFDETLEVDTNEN